MAKKKKEPKVSFTREYYSKKAGEEPVHIKETFTGEEAIKEIENLNKKLSTSTRKRLTCFNPFLEECECEEICPMCGRRKRPWRIWW